MSHLIFDYGRNEYPTHTTLLNSQVRMGVTCLRRFYFVFTFRIPEGVVHVFLPSLFRPSQVVGLGGHVLWDSIRLVMSLGTRLGCRPDESR